MNLSARISAALLLSLAFVPAISGQETGEWIDWTKSVDVRNDAVAGTWQKTGDGLTTTATRSARLTLPAPPAAEYDFRVRFTRTSGVHSVALIFVAGTGQATFEIDAWSQHLAGLQMIDGRSLRDNPTRATGYTLTNGRAYTALVQVRRDGIRALLNDKLVAEHKTDGSDLSVHDLWRMPSAKALGIGAYEAATTFHSVEVRPAKGSPNQVASRPATTTTTTPTSPSTASPSKTTPRPTTPDGRTAAPRVLMVIANQDFFYREYQDPRQQLENAGIRVEVAAGRKQVCRPHANSGASGTGEVMPDLALADVDASRYDAIMFSGGWGSSMYQYAFPGSYSNPNYNGDRRTKATVNRLLNDFIAQDKYVGALCHGVSVLAWARVNGKSLLDGKRAVGSPRQSPAGIYNGRNGQPLSRWNAEVNGARLSPARSIGDPQTSADDVVVDGKIITGEDDNSSRLFGATLARLLTGRTE